MKKLPWIITVVCLGVAGVTSYGYYTKNQDNQKLALNNIIYNAENRILKEEVATLERRQTYEEGCRDTLIKMGGPQTPGAYMDGWNAAILTLDTRNYADGYHAAIQQFGYQKTANTRWLIEEPTSSPSEKKPIIPATYPDKK